MLSRLRDGELEMTAEVAEALLRMVDTVRALLDVVERTGADQDPSVDVDPVAALIEALLVAPPAVVVEEPPPAAEQPVAPAVEDLVAPVDVPEPAERRSLVDSSVRVDVELLDNLVQLVGELVLTRNQILQRSDSHEDVELVRASQRLDLVASELQESVMRTRMQPIGNVFSKFPRVVRDLSAKLGKQCDVQMEGKDVEVDKTILEAIGDPLSLDHLEQLSVADAQAELTALPGVGRKTAACVLLFAYGMRDVPVDTHVSRVGTRLGLFRPGAPFAELHDDMLAFCPPGQELELHVNLLRHGRRTCVAQRPRCPECVLRRSCPFARG
jgi:two-component system chemotaxis sensor kinase CheA